MRDELLRCGEAEYFKAGWHLAVFGLAVACGAYSAMAFTERRERHLARNVLVYAALSWFEAVQILRHIHSADQGPPL